MKTVYVCPYCGSANIVRDAFVHANDPADVRTFDNCYCENCETSVDTPSKVVVPNDFDERNGIYKEEK